ncbi:hypothetical protein [Bacteroides sp. 51]|uniref:hypothetical protein n=1 Tax=Bacteroides sp. 51 TaxID=2302938 RepID=UPI0013D8033E|nr:hypothetical protein [Bacteroides sp. 51]NDV80570.1 hypothetical protein [Bacteroides sp. 51]
MKQTKKKYVAPQIEVITVQNEGVMANSVGSGSVGNVDDGGGIFQGASSTRTGTKHQSRSSMDEWGDMINDLLTF